MTRHDLTGLVLASLLASGLVQGLGCGARTGLDDRSGPHGGGCRDDEDCPGGSFCTGLQVCLDGRCRDGPLPACGDDDPCTHDRCSDELRSCFYDPTEIDSDSDGWLSSVCGGDDCDDTDSEIHPDAPELCNDRDDDCDGSIDEVEPPRRIAEAELDSSAFGHSLVWAEEQFFYAWHNASDLARSLYLARVNPLGDFAAEPFEASEPSPDSYSPSLAWSGEVMALAFHHISFTDRSDSLALNRYDASGRSLDPALRLDESEGELRTPRVAWSGSRFGVVYRHGHFGSGNSEIDFFSVNEAGEFDAVERRIADDRADSYMPDIAWTGEAFAVAWLDELDGEFAVQLARLSEGGDPLGEAVTVARASTYCYSLSLIRTEDLLIASWTELVYPFDARIRFVVASVEGVPLGPPTALGPEAEGATSPALTWTGRELGLVWVSYLGPVQPDTLAELRFAWADEEGVLSEEPISLTPPGSRSRRPAIGWSGDEVGIAWLDDLDPDGEGVYFTRVCRR